jgi:hypothetical protein
VTLLGPDGIILYQSAGGRSVLGYKVGAFPGKTFVPLTHPDDAAYSRVHHLCSIEDLLSEQPLGDDDSLDLVGALVDLGVLPTRSIQ